MSSEILSNSAVVVVRQLVVPGLSFFHRRSLLTLVECFGLVLKCDLFRFCLVYLVAIEEVLNVEQIYVAYLVHRVRLLLCETVCICLNSSIRSIEASLCFLACSSACLGTRFVLIICKNA